ncbi:MAG: type II toxin-antitoxin system HicB family antitoxin [Acidobacteriota bacterium]
MPKRLAKKLSFTTHLFREGKLYVAYVPELDLSTCGESPEEARDNIRDAVEGSLETSEELGTLEEILEEAGFQLKKDTWQPPEFVSLDRLTVTLN